MPEKREIAGDIWIYNPKTNKWKCSSNQPFGPIEMDGITMSYLVFSNVAKVVRE